MMLIFGDGGVLDFELNFLRELMRVVDGHLADLEERAVRCGDPDQFGILDSMEHVTGFGFVACQRYVTAIAGDLRVAKSEALDNGPIHSSRHTVASLVNHAANYWNHADEWSPDASKRAWDRTIAAVVALAGDRSDYPLISFLSELVAPAQSRFGALVPRLEEWREAVRGARRLSGSAGA